MEQVGHFEQPERADSPLNITAIDALWQHVSAERNKTDELTKKLNAAGIPTGNNRQPASSVNKKTARRGGNHRRSWRG